MSLYKLNLPTYVLPFCPPLIQILKETLRGPPPYVTLYVSMSLYKLNCVIAFNDSLICMYIVSLSQPAPGFLLGGGGGGVWGGGGGGGGRIGPPWLSLAPPWNWQIITCCACGYSYAPPRPPNYILPFCPSPLGQNPERNPACPPPLTSHYMQM